MSNLKQRLKVDIENIKFIKYPVYKSVSLHQGRPINDLHKSILLYCHSEQV